MGSQFEADPEKSTDELLAQITSGAVSGFNHSTSVMAIPPFAALLVRLGRQSDVAAKRLEVLTKRLLWVTWVLLLATLFLAVTEGITVYENYFFSHQITTHTTLPK